MRGKLIHISGLDFDATFDVVKGSNDRDDPLDAVFLCNGDTTADISDIVGGLYYKDHVVKAGGDFDTVVRSLEQELQERYHEE